MHTQIEDRVARTLAKLEYGEFGSQDDFHGEVADDIVASPAIRRTAEIHECSPATAAYIYALEVRIAALGGNGLGVRRIRRAA